MLLTMTQNVGLYDEGNNEVKGLCSLSMTGRRCVRHEQCVNADSTCDNLKSGWSCVDLHPVFAQCIGSVTVLDGIFIVKGRADSRVGRGGGGEEGRREVEEEPC